MFAKEQNVSVTKLKMLWTDFFLKNSLFIVVANLLFLNKAMVNIYCCTSRTSQF